MPHKLVYSFNPTRRGVPLSKNIMAHKQKYMEIVAVMRSDAIPHSFRFKMVASVIRVAYQIIKEQYEKLI